MRTVEYKSNKHGVVSIVTCKNNTVQIWLDPEEVEDGFLLENSGADPEDWYRDTFFDDIDFSDLPIGGVFKSESEAVLYIENKLGKLTEI